VTAVPFDYEKDASEPSRWFGFLRDLWGEDVDSVKALQEFFGYVVSGRLDMHKILLLVGPTRAGKGVIARTLTAMVGQDNVAGPTLSSLAGEFGLAPLLGKPLAIVSDARLSGRGSQVVVERLLAISGEDTITVNRKYKEQWSGKLPSRFMVISNELPQLGDASAAIAGRFERGGAVGTRGPERAAGAGRAVRRPVARGGMRDARPRARGSGATDLAHPPLTIRSFGGLGRTTAAGLSRGESASDPACSISSATAAAAAPERPLGTRGASPRRFASQRRR
jgi:hypothetical protein